MQFTNYDVDTLEMLLQAATTGTTVFGVDYPDKETCELWGLNPDYSDEEKKENDN